MLNADQIAVIKFVDEGAEQVPVGRRIQLYRGMAEFLSVREDAHIRKNLMDRANILEEAQMKCAQLHLHFT